MFLFYVKGRFYCNHLGSELRLSSVGVGCSHTSTSKAEGTWHCWPPEHMCALDSPDQVTKSKRMVQEVMSKFSTISRNSSHCTLPIILLLRKMRTIKKLTSQ